MDQTVSEWMWEARKPLSDPDLVAAMVAAEDALSRLDERLARSEIAEGWRSRTDFADACANVWADGGLVLIEDVVLHDCSMNLSAPNPDLGRAHAVLQARRRIGAAAPGWSLNRESVDHLLGRRPVKPAAPVRVEDDLDREMAALDALLARTSRVLDRVQAKPEQVSDGFTNWRNSIDACSALPPVFAAALAAEAWTHFQPLRDEQAWLGRLLVGDLLRKRGKSRHHLPALSVGLKALPRGRHRSTDRPVRLTAYIEAIRHAADQGLRDHDRWILAREVLRHKAKDRTRSSRLGDLIDLQMTLPLTTAQIIASRLNITQRGATKLVSQLGLRELTGRSRYRAWSVL